jgi:hypothetical protein
MFGEQKQFEAHSWWSEDDRTVLRAILGYIRPKTVLEFGSGDSTLTIAEAGIPWIDTFEDNEKWYDFNYETFKQHRSINHYLYQRRDPLFLPQVQVQCYDLGFVDGPRWVEEREPEMIYAGSRCRALAVHDFWYDEMQEIVDRLFSKLWSTVTFEKSNGEAIGLLLRMV